MTKPVLKKILYTEDEPDISTIVLIALQEIGNYEIKACATGQEAIDIAAEFKPDLLLLDIMMPEKDGLTTLNELRNIPATANTPVIFMTAKVQSTEIENYYKLGAIDVIAKPFDPMQLAEMLQSSWDKHYGHQ